MKILKAVPHSDLEDLKKVWLIGAISTDKPNCFPRCGDFLSPHLGVLQLRTVNVEVYAIDAFDFQRDRRTQNFRDGQVVYSALVLVVEVCVGDKAGMIAWEGCQLHGCPHPLTIALELVKTSRQYKYVPLIH